MLEGLERELPLLIDKVQLLSGFEAEKREPIRSKVSKLSEGAMDLLIKILLEGPFSIPEDQFVR